MDKNAIKPYRCRFCGKSEPEVKFTDDRYFHVYHSTGKDHGEREDVEERIERMYRFLQNQYGTSYELTGNLKNYFKPFYDKDGLLATVKENKKAIKRELKLCGYFVIVTSEKMTAEEAIDLYCSRDASEKLFRGDKSYLGNKSLRVYGSELANAKIFIEFVALIVRNRIYKRLKD